MGVPADPQAAAGALPMHTLDRRWLLALYAVIPFAVGLMLLDQALLGSHLRRAVLPVAPEEWPAWTILFGMPHVIAGLLTMADREYLGYYRRRFCWPLLGFGAISIAAATGPGQLAFSVALWLGFYTVTHLLTQQIGLAFTMLHKPPVGWMRLWKWTMLVLGVLVYAGLLIEMNLPDASLGGLDPHALVVLGGAGLLALLLVPTAVLARRAVDRCAAVYVWSNWAMVAAILAAFAWRYPVFILLIPRIIHDLTAFLVYFNHDSNRNAQYGHNLLYRRARRGRTVAFWILPTVSVGLAYALQINEFPLFIAINFFLTFMHYHIESVVWRRPHLHRQCLVLS